MTKGADERNDGVFQCFSHIERIGNDRIANRVNVGECIGSYLVNYGRGRMI